MPRSRASVFSRVFWIDTITILVLWRSTITIRLFGKIPLQFLFCHSNTMFYVWDGLGPNRRRIPPVRFPVWPILPPAQEVKGVGLLCLPRPTAIVVLLCPSPFPRRCAPQTLADGGESNSGAGGESNSGAGGEKNQSEGRCDGPCRPQWVIRSRAFRCAVRWRWRTTTAGMDLPPPLVA